MKKYGTQPRWEEPSDTGDEPTSHGNEVEHADRATAQLEARLRDDRALARSALEHLPDGVIVCDTDGRFVYVNEAAREIWGGLEEAESLDDWGEFKAFHADGSTFDPDDWGMATCLRDEETVEPRAIEIERFDGSRAVILGSSAPYYGAGGELRGAVALFSDITELKQFEQAQRRARKTAEQAASRMASLQAVTTELFDALTPEQAVRTALEHAQRLLDADRSAGALVTDPDQLEIVADHGYGDVLDGYRRFDLGAPLPMAESIRLATGVFISDLEQYGEKYPHLSEPPDHTPSPALAAVPLLVHGEAVGALLLGYTSAREFDEHDRAFLQTLAGQCAQAVRRAELYRDEQKARAEAEIAHRRTRFLSEATAILNSKLDYDEILEQIARMAVPEMADWCAVDLVGPDHDLRDPVAVAHTDPEKVEMAREYRRKHPPDEEVGGAAEAMHTGESAMLSEVPDELLRARARNDEHLDYLRRIEMKSVMVAPMSARGRTLGAITFVSSDPEKRFGEHDLEIAEELASRAAMAVERAELYRKTREARSKVARRAEQQKAVAELARRALELEPDALFDEALELLVEMLDADTAKLLEYREDSTLVLRAGVGWREEWMGANLGPAADNAAIGHALLENEVVVVEDLSDADLGSTELVTAHDLQSAMAVQVPGRRRPFGAIGVHSREPTRFTKEDSEFIRGISNVLSDAIEKEHVERRREATYRRLGKAMRDREELLSVLSHDLRSPASAVKMNLGLIDRYLDRLEAGEATVESLRDSVASADASVARMVEMMTTLLEGARDDAARRDVSYESMNFGRVLRDVLERLEGEFAESASRLETDIASDLPGRCDRVRFEQIATNLLSNALKYGDGEPIEVVLRSNDTFAELVVRDRGIGIAPEHQDQIFERFHRVEGEDGTDSFGLGLWIVKRSVDALAGTIEFESTPGEGTDFRVRLPLNPAN